MATSSAPQGMQYVDPTPIATHTVPPEAMEGIDQAPLVQVIYPTQGRVSSDIQTLRSGLKNETQTKFFFNQLRSVLLFVETVFRVFDIACQSSLK